MNLDKPSEAKEKLEKETPSSPPRPPKEDLPEEILKNLKSQETVDQKVDLLFVHIEESLSRNPPNFKLFWGVRRELLVLFKEINPPPARNNLWEKLSLLTTEARRKKDELIKESSFAEEQIEEAISLIENEMKDPQMTPIDKEALFPEELHLFEDNTDFYLDIQGQLNLLNRFASRINALRKELIHTNMRVRVKNRFFDRLSKLGNEIFPHRKELIQEISHRFCEDVEDFCSQKKEKLTNNNTHFGQLKAQIKELQKLAKTLTLNTFAFNETRKNLSGLWDQMKGLEKERKKEISQFKEESLTYMAPFLEELNELQELIQKEEIHLRQAEERLSTILADMKRTRLDRHHVKELKEKIFTLKDPIDQKMEEEARLYRERELAKEEKRAEEVDGFIQKMKGEALGWQ